MTEREYSWTERGRTEASANGVDLAEVIQALHSPSPLVHLVGPDLLAICGIAENGRLITALCERYAPEPRMYLILFARPASLTETLRWENRL